MPVNSAADRGRRQSFRPSDRLRHASEFSAVFKNAARAGDQNFTVLGRANDAGCARLGLAISLKTAGGAVARNRVKRAARESFRILRPDLGGIDVIVMARRGISSKTRAQMRASLDKLFRSIDRKCAES